VVALFRLRSTGIQHIVKALALAGAPLRSLDLDANHLGDAGVAHLAAALPSLRRLRQLSLRDNWISDTGAGCLARGLDSLLDLIFLDVEGNRICAAGRSALVVSLDKRMARAHGECGFGFVY
jgi:Ran GTPase-activating protein (RanGAP) involved in mRNA processing and transport